MPLPPAPPAFRLSNLLRVAGRLSLRIERLARLGPDDPALSSGLTALQTEAARHHARVLELCADEGVTPRALPEPSRRAVAGLLHLADAARLAAHVAAVRCGNAALRLAAPGRALRVELVPSASLWRWRPEGDGAVLAVSLGFLTAGPADWAALAEAATHARAPAARAAVRAFTETPAYRAVIATIDRHAVPAGEPTRGAAHDLAERFDAVNARYFSGALPRPALTWGRAPTVHRFGSYEPVRDRVVISKTLDRPDVPVRVVDYLLFHELLHKKLGSEALGHRRAVHTAAFRAEEARFEGLDDVLRFLEGLARAERARRPPPRRDGRGTGNR